MAASRTEGPAAPSRGSGPGEGGGGLCGPEGSLSECLVAFEGGCPPFSLIPVPSVLSASVSFFPCTPTHPSALSQGSGRDDRVECCRLHRLDSSTHQPMHCCKCLCQRPIRDAPIEENLTAQRANWQGRGTAATPFHPTLQRSGPGHFGLA